MSAHSPDRDGVKRGSVAPWSTLLPVLIIVALIFLSPVIFDVFRGLGTLLGGK